MQTVYVLTRVHSKTPANDDCPTQEFRVQKVFTHLVNAEAHILYLRSRYTANGYVVTGIVKVTEAAPPCVIGGLWAYKDYEDESGTEHFRYELTEILEN